MSRKTAPPPAKRAYNSTRRSAQAAQTRDDVVHAAIELFGERGWAGTTLAAIAERAGVAVETVYKAVGAKAALLRLAMDVAVAGDTEPIPFADRPEARALGEGAEDERIARGIGIVATIHERSAGVWLATLEASSKDDDVDGWRREIERNRRLDVARSTERIFGRPLDDELVTLLWVLYGPETYLKLVRDEGRSREEYEAYLLSVTRRLRALA